MTATELQEFWNAVAGRRRSAPCFIPWRKEVIMSPPVDIARAWKEEEYRKQLSDAERAQLPPHPAGLIELTENDLEAIAGGDSPEESTGCPYWY
jgi:mersacidin/lichenicidin family type 2 lantibiotic